MSPSISNPGPDQPDPGKEPSLEPAGQSPEPAANPINDSGLSIPEYYGERELEPGTLVANITGAVRRLERDGFIQVHVQLEDGWDPLVEVVRDHLPGQADTIDNGIREQQVKAYLEREEVRELSTRLAETLWRANGRPCEVIFEDMDVAVGPEDQAPIAIKIHSALATWSEGSAGPEIVSTAVIVQAKDGWESSTNYIIDKNARVIPVEGEVANVLTSTDDGDFVRTVYTASAVTAMLEAARENTQYLPSSVVTGMCRSIEIKEGRLPDTINIIPENVEIAPEDSRVIALASNRKYYLVQLDVDSAGSLCPEVKGVAK